MKVSNNISKRSCLIVSFSILCVMFVAAIPLSICIRTSREMDRTGLFLQGHHTEGELQAVYRKSTTFYENYRDLPEYYLRGMEAYTNCLFQVYQREGMPYWFFVVAVNPESRVIEHGVVRKLGQ